MAGLEHSQCECEIGGPPTIADGICANTQEHITRCARARGLMPFSQTYMCLISGLRAALFSNILGEHPQKLDVACSGRCAPPIFS